MTERPRLESHDSPRQIEPKGTSLSGAPGTSSVTDAMPTDTLASTPSNSAVQDGDDDVASEFWSEAKGLQPSTLLNRESSKRKFSLQHILSTNRSPRRAQVELDGEGSSQQDDPVVEGIVSESIAAALFDRSVCWETAREIDANV